MGAENFLAMLEIRNAVCNDSLSEMKSLLDARAELLQNEEFTQELLITAVTYSENNFLRCAIYLMDVLDLDPTRLSEVSVVNGNTPLHSLCFTLSGGHHLTDTQQYNTLDAIIRYELRHDRSPMTTIEMNTVSATTPFDILNESQKIYYSRTKQQALEDRAKKSLPPPLQSQTTPPKLVNFTHYLFSFMAKKTLEKNQDGTTPETAGKKIKYE